MNPAVYASLPASACSLGTQGTDGPDRISKTVYNAAGQVSEQRVAVGITGEEAAERTLTYSNNGKLQTLKDAENNLTTYEYDDHDRLSKTRFPNLPKGSGTSSTTDYELLGYDAASNVTSFRNRANETIASTYDNLNRRTLKNLPGSEPDVTYAYDNLGRLTSATQTGNSLSFTYDALSRNLTQVGPLGTVSSAWDLAGRRTQLTYPGTGLFVNYDYLVTGEMTKVRENGVISGVGVLATYDYDNLRRRTKLTFGNGVVQNFGYDPVSRLASLTNELPIPNNLSATFAYNPASQITTNVRTGDTYAWTGHFNENKTGVPNGLNQLTAVGTKTLTHDAKGNVTAFGTKSFSYSSENLLLTGPNSTTLAYDPMMRLYQVTSGASTRFAYDGLDRIAEYDGGNVLQFRYVHGPGVDDPLVRYEGSGTTSRRFHSADERGSIVTVTNNQGGLIGTGPSRYDEYGQPQSTNTGIWGYTGQAWLPSMGVWYYKARVYDPELGRFLQTDPIGYEDRPNFYAYVGNDPVNRIDPLGLLRQFPRSICRGSDFCSVIQVAPQNVYTYEVSWIPTTTGGARDVRIELISITTISGYTIGSSFGDTFGGLQLASAGGWWLRHLHPVITALELLLTHGEAKAPAPGIPVFPTNPGQLRHIFSNREGHYPNLTPEVRTEIYNALRHYSHRDRFGNDIYGFINPNGTQTWVQVRNGVIQNTGLNTTPLDLFEEFRP